MAYKGRGAGYAGRAMLGSMGSKGWAGLQAALCSRVVAASACPGAQQAKRRVPPAIGVLLCRHAHTPRRWQNAAVCI